MVFTDGTSVPCDLVVWATGYNVTFPFLDPALVSAEGNDLPLWKRVVHPDLPGLFFVGLLQPLGAVMPLAEAQSGLIADLLTGHYALPAESELRAPDGGRRRGVQEEVLRLGAPHDGGRLRPLPVGPRA